MDKAQWLALDAALSAALNVAERKGEMFAQVRRVAGVLAHSGDSWFWVAGLLLVGALGGRDWRARAGVLTWAIIGLAVAVQLVKRLIARPRPDGEWGAIYRNSDPHSFPSGHAARAGLLFGLAPVVGPAWFGWLVMTWSPLMALSRVVMGVHYLSDVIGGFGLGLLVAMVLGRGARKRMAKVEK